MTHLSNSRIQVLLDETMTLAVGGMLNPKSTNFAINVFQTKVADQRKPIEPSVRGFIVVLRIHERPREKTNNLHNVKTKTQISFAVTTKLISSFLFATQIVHFLFFLNPKFEASFLLL